MTQHDYALMVALGKTWKFPGDICTGIITLVHAGPAEDIYLEWGLCVANHPADLWYFPGFAPGSNPIVLRVANDLSATGYTFQVQAPFPEVSVFPHYEGETPSNIWVYTNLWGNRSGYFDTSNNWHSGASEDGYYGTVEPEFSAVGYAFT
jgi:hypothetical protein